jgi:hypothetical protein
VKFLMASSAGFSTADASASVDFFSPPPRQLKGFFCPFPKWEKLDRININIYPCRYVVLFRDRSMTAGLLLAET